jgi:hypothetical protein
MSFGEQRCAQTYLLPLGIVGLHGLGVVNLHVVPADVQEFVVVLLELNHQPVVPQLLLLQNEQVR